MKATKSTIVLLSAPSTTWRTISAELSVLFVSANAYLIYLQVAHIYGVPVWRLKCGVLTLRSNMTIDAFFPGETRLHHDYCCRDKTTQISTHIWQQCIKFFNMTSMRINFLSSFIWDVLIDLASRDRRVEYCNVKVLRGYLSLLMQVIQLLEIMIKSVQHLSGNMLHIDTGNS